jgi:hypothetical protein
MPKPLGPGSEVDSYCTKCKLDLNHRIISMDGDKVFKVECLTCRGHHRYRRPKSAEPVARTVKRAVSERVPKPKAADQLRKVWQDAIMGRTAGDFVAYRIDQEFSAGQLVRHKKFGDGVVNEVVDPGKVEVLFEDGPRMLAQGR